MKTFLGGLAAVGICAVTAFAADSARPVSAVHTAVMAELTATIKGARQIAVFEGVPRDKQKELVAAEQARSQNGVALYDARLIEGHHGQWFYPKGRAITPDVAADLLKSVLDAAAPYRGLKLCGGFHADYALQWGGPTGLYEVQVCFGCGELRLITPEATLQADIPNGQAENLRKRFAPYKQKSSVQKQSPN